MPKTTLPDIRIWTMIPFSVATEAIVTRTISGRPALRVKVRVIPEGWDAISAGALVAGTVIATPGYRRVVITGVRTIPARGFSAGLSFPR
jgi:hypothetical protein